VCAAATGEVFVGVDLNGSLGKGANKGKIVRLVDGNHDGIADSHTVFAAIDNPRGMISIGAKLFVLHTRISEDTGLLSGMHLSVLRDENWDGVADGKPQRLVSDISVARHNQVRGADHTTNGIQMGIDGWIYIAVGDFGMVGARGTDGASLTMLGGGIVRVRPDGRELEIYTHGTRNIYDVAIDPFMNIFTRGNTNDGGGWNVRFIHHVQSAEYGYPVLFKNFTGEILPALGDLGGGSGTGALYFGEPGWPKKYSNVPMMGDWGRNELFIHRLTPDGASFTQKPEDFIKIPQITDVDVDGSGRLYLAAWDGAGYKGSPERGFVERVVPKDWTYREFPDLAKTGDAKLIGMLKLPSAVARLRVQQELLARQADADAVLELARDSANTPETRVAAIFTARQLGVSTKKLLALTSDDFLREFALRAGADRKTQLNDLPVELYIKYLHDKNPRVQVAAAVGLGRMGDLSAARALLDVANPPRGTFQPQPNAAPVAKPAFMSKKMKPHQTQNIKVSIEGWKELHLVVTDGGDGNGHDHAAWFQPVLVMADGSEKKLTELRWKSATQGWGETRINKDCTGKPLAHAPVPSAGKQKKKNARSARGRKLFGIGTHAPSHIVYQLPKGAVWFRANVGATIGAVDGRGYVEYVVNSKNPVFQKNTDGPHATPNSGLIVPHIAVRSLVKLGAVDACLSALDGSNRQAALWSLKYLYSAKVIDRLLGELKTEKEQKRRDEIIALLARLYQKEAPYDGSWWWSTRPDTRGPFYKLATWEKSKVIAGALKKEYAGGTAHTKHQLEFWNAKLRLGFEEMTVADATGPETDQPTLDLAKISSGAVGEVGKTSIEDVILGLEKTKGDIKTGEKLFTQQGCIVCHTTEKSQPLKGPFMGQVGAILTREQIAESILKPNASISQGFATVMISTKDGNVLTGFISAETADQIEIRDITGQVHKVKSADVKERKELAVSIMPPGLVNSLSLKDFASLVDFLASKKK